MSRSRDRDVEIRISDGQDILLRNGGPRRLEIVHEVEKPVEVIKEVIKYVDKPYTVFKEKKIVQDKFIDVPRKVFKDVDVIRDKKTEVPIKVKHFKPVFKDTVKEISNQKSRFKAQSVEKQVKIPFERHAPTYVEEITETLFEVPESHNIDIVFETVKEIHVVRDRHQDVRFEVQTFKESVSEKIVDKEFILEKIVEKPVYVEKVVRIPKEKIVEVKVYTKQTKFLEVPREKFLERKIEIQRII